MTPADKLITGTQEMSLDDCNQVMQDARKGKLPIVSSEFELVALISRSGKFKSTKCLLHYLCINSHVFIGSYFCSLSATSFLLVFPTG